MSDLRTGVDCNCNFLKGACCGTFMEDTNCELQQCTLGDVDERHTRQRATSKSNSSNDSSIIAAMTAELTVVWAVGCTHEVSYLYNTRSMM